MKGLYGKYTVSRTDGKPTKGFHFVLKPETDEAARAALRIYIAATDNDALADDLQRILDGLEGTRAMTKLDECNGWHRPDEGDVPDTVREVWIVEKYELFAGLMPQDYIGWHNANGWFNSSTRDKLYAPPVLWHEIDLPDIPLDLAKASMVVMP